jgi:hypothetical protein
MSAPQVYHNTGKVIAKRVFFTGSTAISKGIGLCYERDYTSTTTGETATDACALRDARVELPSNANNLTFAGVALKSYPAKTNGQWVEIAEPGSVVKILTDTSIATTVGVTCVTCLTGTGKFTTVGFGGRGTARALQTDADGGLILAELLDGEESGLVESVTPAAGAITLMAGGVTRLQEATLASNATFTMAAGLYAGMKKKFECEATMTTSDVVVTVSGYQADASTALLTASFDADGEDLELAYVGGAWTQVGVAGATLAAS